MTASTVSSTQASYGDKFIQPTAFRVQSYFNSIPNRPRGEQLWITPAITIPTTSIDDTSDRVKLFQIPANMGPVYLDNLKVTATDMDTHATPTLVFDILTYTTTDGTTLISGSTIGQAGGVDELDLNVSVRYTDLSGKYIALKTTTTAATAAAGTITIAMKVFLGRATLPV